MKKMNQVILVSQSSDQSVEVENLLAGAGYHIIAKLNDNDNIAMSVAQLDPDFVVFQFEALEDEVLATLLKTSVDAPTPVILSSPNFDEESLERVISSGIDAYVIDDINQRNLPMIVSLAVAQFEKMKKLNNELTKAKASLLERKTVEKAKGILMRQRMVDEDVAYKILRTHSMNQGKKMFDVAEGVISASELLS